MKTDQPKVNPFSLLHSSKPQMVIQSRIRHYRSVIDLARTAEQKGYDVSFEHGHSVHEVQLSEGVDSLSPLKSHSIRSAQRYLEQHPGLS